MDDHVLYVEDSNDGTPFFAMDSHILKNMSSLFNWSSKVNRDYQLDLKGLGCCSEEELTSFTEWVDNTNAVKIRVVRVSEEAIFNIVERIREVSKPK